MRHIFVIRHAQASFGSKNYDALSDLGFRQAEKLGAWLSLIGIKPDRILTGGLNRHIQTAETCLKAMGQRLELEHDQAFAEYDHLAIIEAFDPQFHDQITNLAEHGAKADMADFKTQFSKAVARWVSGAHESEYNETYKQFITRVEQGLWRLSQQSQAEETLLVFTSGGPKTILYRAMSGVETPKAFEMGHRFLNTSIMRVSVQDQNPHLLSLNGVPHLEIAGDNALFTYI